MMRHDMGFPSRVFVFFCFISFASTLLPTIHLPDAFIRFGKQAFNGVLSEAERSYPGCL